jgi:hypothetical protein
MTRKAALLLRLPCLALLCVVVVSCASSPGRYLPEQLPPVPAGMAQIVMVRPATLWGFAATIVVVDKGEGAPYNGFVRTSFPISEGCRPLAIVRIWTEHDIDPIESVGAGWYRLENGVTVWIKVKTTPAHVVGELSSGAKLVWQRPPGTMTPQIANRQRGGFDLGA